MPTTEVNSITTPESTGKPVVHEDLIKIARQMVQHEVMTFASAAERTAVFATLGITPNKGSLSYLQDSGAFEEYSGGWIGMAAIGRGEGINNACGAGTTTSATYVDFPATSSLTYTKIHAATRLRVHVDVGFYSAGAVAAARIGVRIAGTDYDFAHFAFNEANSYRTCSGTRYIPSIAAGAQTLQLRWYRFSGAGTLTSESNSWLSLEVLEVR